MGKSSFYTRIINLVEYITSENIESVKKRLFDNCMPEPNTGCFFWTGQIYNGGYGRICVKDKRLMVHRVSYFIHKGIIPEDFVVDHLCNNTFCINPYHLEAKTQKDNGYRAINSLTTINSLKTHCIRGHEFTKENTYIAKTGRVCITCSKESKRNHYIKNKYNKNTQTEEFKILNRIRVREYYKKNKEIINEKRRNKKTK